jgi:hypothetical protein
VVAEEGSSEVVAFLRLVERINLAFVRTYSIRRNQPEQITVILLARMAVDRRHHGK